MPLIYTPVVGAACTNWSSLVCPSRGLYVSLADAGRVEQVLRAWPQPSVRAICVTDGERILGLGDLGANGMGIPIGKLALYSALAGVNPRETLPVTIDVGTNNDEILADPLYIGLRQRRATGAAYDKLIEEFVVAVQTVFGADCLIQWEDFGNTNAFRILHEYKERCVSFNDDIEGTASVVLGGILSACKTVPNVPQLEQSTFVFFGAGEAGCGIANLIAYAIRERTQCTDAESRARIWLVDSRGLVTAERAAAEGHAFAHHKLPYAHAAPRAADGSGLLAPAGDLEAVVRLLRPTALIGVSAQPGTFTEPVVRAMAEHNARPLIFALSNPTEKCECTAEQAYAWTDGRAVFASGSPFDAVTLALPGGETRTFEPGQGNNAYIFPALGLACLAVRMSQVPQHSIYVAACALADFVRPERVAATGCIYPSLTEIRAVSAAIATRVAEDAYARGIAQRQPRPDDMAAHIRANMWTPSE
jgi:malate dehydrogenase (oxaloacetate-decarboxylating)(NADP+)